MSSKPGGKRSSPTVGPLSQYARREGRNDAGELPAPPSRQTTDSLQITQTVRHAFSIFSSTFVPFVTVSNTGENRAHCSSFSFGASAFTWKVTLMFW